MIIIMYINIAYLLIHFYMKIIQTENPEFRSHYSPDGYSKPRLTLTGYYEDESIDDRRYILDFDSIESVYANGHSLVDADTEEELTLGEALEFYTDEDSTNPCDLNDMHERDRFNDATAQYENNLANNY